MTSASDEKAYSRYDQYGVLRPIASAEQLEAQKAAMGN